MSLQTNSILIDYDGIIQGPPGETGATFIPSVSEDGVLSWSNDKGLKNPPSVNIKGSIGDAGQVGATFIPHVSTDGVLSWTNDKNLNNPDSVNIMGPVGEFPQDAIDRATAAAEACESLVDGSISTFLIYKYNSSNT